MEETLTIKVGDNVSYQVGRHSGNVHVVLNEKDYVYGFYDGHDIGLVKLYKSWLTEINGRSVIGLVVL